MIVLLFMLVLVLISLLFLSSPILVRYFFDVIDEWAEIIDEIKERRGKR